ncbi:MAG: alpha/beta fold hydrolase [Planctomycetota bacterium]
MKPYFQPGRKLPAVPLRANRGDSPSRFVQYVNLSVLLSMLMTACSTAPSSLLLIQPTSDAGASHQVLVVTSRQPIDDPLLRYGDGRAESLSYNDVAIWVPDDRNPGSVSYPSSTPKVQKEFAITEFQQLDTSSFADTLDQRLERIGPSKAVFVFVHGYNVPYSNGVYRIGQLVADFEADAVPVHYSWPSDGHTLGYLYDRDSVQFSRDGFVDLMVQISESDAESIFIMGHSMGTLLVMEGLRQLSLMGRDDILNTVSPLVLASPDIDVDVFKRQVGKLSTRPDPFIVFVASDDGALKFSERLRGGHARVGEGLHIPTLQNLGIAVIDLSNVELGDGSQHSAFASSPTLIRIMQQARLAQQTLQSADDAEQKSPLETLSDFTSGLIHLPERVLDE